MDLNEVLDSVVRRAARPATRANERDYHQLPVVVFDPRAAAAVRVLAHARYESSREQWLAKVASLAVRAALWERWGRPWEATVVIAWGGAYRPTVPGEGWPVEGADEIRANLKRVMQAAFNRADTTDARVIINTMRNDALVELGNAEKFPRLPGDGPRERELANSLAELADAIGE